MRDEERHRASPARLPRAALVLAVTAAALLATVAQPRRPRPAAERRHRLRGQRPSSTEVFNLDATDGYITMPDGNSIYMWSYTANGARLPVPRPDTVREVRRHRDGHRCTTTCARTRRSSSPARRRARPTAHRPSRVRRRRRRRPPPWTQRGSGRAGARHLHVHRRGTGHVPLLLGHRRQQAARDGPLRRADRAPGDGATPAGRQSRCRTRPPTEPGSATATPTVRPGVPVPAELRSTRPCTSPSRPTSRTTTRRARPSTSSSTAAACRTPWRRTTRPGCPSQPYGALLHIQPTDPDPTRPWPTTSRRR